MTETDPPERLSASQISLILQRAAEIDARGESLSVEELSQIAAEAGIDPRATSVAIQEVLAEERPAPVPPAPPLPAPPSAAPSPPVAKRASPSPRRILTGGAVGVALGFALAVSAGNSIALLLPALGGMALYLLLRAVQAMRRGEQWDYQLQNFAIWLAALVTTGTLVEDFFYPAFLVPFMMLWIVTSVLGGLLVRFGPREPDGAGDPPGDAPAAPD